MVTLFWAIPIHKLYFSYWVASEKKMSVLIWGSYQDILIIDGIKMWLQKRRICITKLKLKVLIIILSTYAPASSFAVIFSPFSSAFHFLGSHEHHELLSFKERALVGTWVESVSILSKACVLDSWFSAPFFIDVFGGSQTLLSVEVRIFSKAMSLLLTYITVFSSRLRMFVWNERSVLLIFGYKDMHDGCIAETSLPISLITKWKFAVNSFSWKREACKLLIT